MPINPKDMNAIKHLVELEEAGEKGFETYYTGNVEAGAKQIKDVLSESELTIRSIRNPKLQQELSKLFEAMNQALREYIKSPSKENLNSLEDDLENYKSFLDRTQT